MKNTGNQETKQYYLIIDGQEVTVTEEVYRAYKRPIWAEHKRNDREKLCQVSDGKGSLKRCTDDCSKCNRTREGSVLSVDGLDEAGYSVEDKTQDVLEIVIEKCFLKNFLKSLKNQTQTINAYVSFLWMGIQKGKLLEPCQFHNPVLNTSSKS